MDTDVTILGFFKRQMADGLAPLKIISLILVYIVAHSAAARDRSGGVDQQILPTQSNVFLNWEMSQRNQPALSPSANGIGTITSFGPNGQLDLWPYLVDYTRLIKFKRPYINSDLKMGMEYGYSFTFNLRSRDAQDRALQVPDGWYLLTMAVILPENTTGYFNRGRAAINNYDRYVTSTQMYVRVSGGMVNQRMYLRFDNLTATTIINHLVIELTPLNNDCSTRNSEGKVIIADTCIKTNSRGKADPLRSKPIPLANYKSYLCEMPFVPYLPGGNAKCNPDEEVSIPSLQKESLSDYVLIAKARKPQSKVPKAPTPNEIARSHGLKLMSPDDSLILEKIGKAYSAERIVTEFTRILNAQDTGAIPLPRDGRWFILGLCRLLVETNTAQPKSHADFAAQSANSSNVTLTNVIQRCSYKPHDYFRMARVTHLYDIDFTKTTPVLAQPMRFSLQTNFMVARTHTEDIAGSFSPAQIGFKALDLFGIGVTGVNYSITYSNSRSKSESTSGSISLGLDFNIIGMNISALKSQRCLEVVPINKSGSPFYNSSSNAPHNGLYICEDPSNKTTGVNEIYSHMFVHAGDTSTIDAYNPLTQSVNLAMRGDREISSFYYLTRRAMKPDHNTNVQPFQMLPSAENYFKYTPPSNARLVVHPVEFASESAPSIGAMLTFNHFERFIDDN